MKFVLLKNKNITIFFVNFKPRLRLVLTNLFIVFRITSCLASRAIGGQFRFGFTKRKYAVVVKDTKCNHNCHLTTFTTFRNLIKALFGK